MIKGDEGKPMSILELISDEPRDVEPYIEYLIEDQRAYMEGSWSRPDDKPDADGKPSTQECVRYQIGSHIIALKTILMKLRRERAASIGTGQAAVLESSR